MAAADEASLQNPIVRHSKQRTGIPISYGRELVDLPTESCHCMYSTISPDVPVRTWGHFGFWKSQKRVRLGPHQSPIRISTNVAGPGVALLPTLLTEDRIHSRANSLAEDHMDLSLSK